ncbi:MAG: hypothetical protein J6D31_09530 [Clostridia bacterium]|nr:hypothetical protein [Clostridia bacterium]
MKKRILSLLMAVCMVAALVPALLVSVTAAENAGFTTAFEFQGENWPTYDSNPGGTEFQFHGNWSVGYYNAGVYSEHSFMDGTHKIVAHNGSYWGGTEGTGLYLTAGRHILTSALPYYGTTTSGAAGADCAYTVTYTARYEGAVDLNFKDITPRPDEQTYVIPADQVPAMYMAVLVNDKMVWPTVDGEITDPADLALIASTAEYQARTDLDLLKNVQVNIGDKIHFVSAAFNTWFGLMIPEVTYHDGYEVVPSRMNQTYGPSDRAWPALRGLNGIGDLVQTSANWQFGTYKPADKTFALHTAQQRNGVDTWSGLTREVVDYNKNSGILLNSGVDLKGAYFFGTEDTAAGVYPAYRTTALATGTGEVSVGKLFIADVNQAELKNATCYVDVYQNDKKVGSITVKTDAAGVATADKTISGLTVNKGDVFTFAAVGGTGAKTLTALPTITYTGISSFMATATTEKYALALEDSAVVVDKTIGMQFLAYATIDTYKDATAANLYVWDASVADKTLENASAVVPLTVNEDFAYTATYNGFAPKEMVDEIAAQVVVLKGEEKLAESPVSTFTVAEAAQAQFDASFDESERELMAAVLNYGTYAQKYFNYKTDDLANKDLDPSYAAIDPDDYLYYAKFDGQKIGSLISASEIDAFSLYLDNSISIRLYINLDDYEKENCSIIVQHGMSEDECVADREGLAVDLANGAALIEGIALNKLSDVHYLRLAVQDGRYRYYGYTFTYSVESFAARMMDSTEANLPELLCAMMELGKQLAE